MEDSNQSNVVKPRIFVGTMFCGESEFSECKRLISLQENVDVKHFLIENMPEYEAHNLLWTTWNNEKSLFDVFIKVDADTLIDDPNMFAKIADEFAQNKRLTGMQIPLHDYFMNGPVFGLNCFSPKVVFTPAPSKLYADRADSGHDITYKHEKVAHLAPAGRHCAYPSDIQSFHFGLHRMKKGQIENIAKVYYAWEQYKDRARLFALHGAMTAASCSGHDYSNQSFFDAFNSLEKVIETQQKFIELSQFINYIRA